MLVPRDVLVQDFRIREFGTIVVQSASGRAPEGSKQQVRSFEGLAKRLGYLSVLSASQFHEAVYGKACVGFFPDELTYSKRVYLKVVVGGIRAQWNLACQDSKRSLPLY